MTAALVTLNEALVTLNEVKGLGSHGLTVPPRFLTPIPLEFEMTCSSQRLIIL